jgi:hypothetical protein
MKLDEDGVRAAMREYNSSLDGDHCGATRRIITAYLTAAPLAPVGGVEPVAWQRRLKFRDHHPDPGPWEMCSAEEARPGWNPDSTPGFEYRPLYSADAITSLSARLAEATSMLSEQGFEYNRKTNALIERHAAQIETLSARLAECERERDEARATIDTIDGLLNTTALCAEIITKQRDEARARIEALEKALKPFAEVAENDIGDDEADTDRFLPMRARNLAPTLTVGMFRAARAAFNKGEG